MNACVDNVQNIAACLRSCMHACILFEFCKLCMHACMQAGIHAFIDAYYAYYACTNSCMHAYHACLFSLHASTFRMRNLYSGMHSLHAYQALVRACNDEALLRARSTSGRRPLRAPGRGYGARHRRCGFTDLGGRLEVESLGLSVSARGLGSARVPLGTHPGPAQVPPGVPLDFKPGLSRV